MCVRYLHLYASVILDRTRERIVLSRLASTKQEYTRRVVRAKVEHSKKHSLPPRSRVLKPTILREGERDALKANLSRERSLLEVSASWGEDEGVYRARGGTNE